MAFHDHHPAAPRFVPYKPAEPTEASKLASLLLTVGFFISVAKHAKMRASTH